MNDIDLRHLFRGLHEQLACDLGVTRSVIDHPGTMGDVSETQWVTMLRNHLPTRYQVNKAFVIDSNGGCSDQIDVVIHDRQYSPFLLNHGGCLYVPAESVYAIFEVKQEMTKAQIDYSGSKASSVRQLHRTSLPIPHAGGTYAPKKPGTILAGLLCLESTWSPPFGDPFTQAIDAQSAESQLDLGCVIRDGGFEVNYPTDDAIGIDVVETDQSLAFFLLRLLGRLQRLATVPRLDVGAYGRWVD